MLSRARDDVSEGQRIPLSALRERLDPGSAASSWMTDPDGVIGRALETSAGHVVTYPLRLDGPVTFAARARLYPHDWRDLAGAVCARVAVSRPGCPPQTLWSVPLRAADRGRHTGSAFRIRVPAAAIALHLSVDASVRPSAQTVVRAIWVDPVLYAGSADPPPARTRTSAESGLTSATAPDAAQPLISVLVPVHDPPVTMLEEAIESVRAQSSPDWELCLVDDGSRDPEVIAALQRHAAAEPRVRLGRHESARGISAATNTALRLASGRFVALLDHDDTLAPDALARIGATLAADPALDMVYSDEDIVDGGRQVWVHLKPDWSPDTLRTNGYTCHLGVYRRSLVQEIGGFRTEFDGSQDIDMILRLTERSDRIAHVPAILYHWRAHRASTAGGDAKPYAYVAARGAYSAHLQRTGLSGRVGYGPPGLYRLSTDLDAATEIAIVTAVDGPDGLISAIRSWRDQPHAAWRAVVGVGASAHGDVARELSRAGAAGERVELVVDDGEERATVLAAAARRAVDGGADQILILQSPAAGLTHDWLARLAGYAGQPGIAAAGPIVLAPDGRVQDGGVALPEGFALALLHGRRTSMDDFFGYGTSVHNVSALSGALLTPSTTYRRLGGLDPTLRELTLVDYCLRAGDDGGRIVTVPDVRLRRCGADRTVNDLTALRALRDRWARTHANDPFYNPGYRTDRGDFCRNAG